MKPLSLAALLLAAPLFAAAPAPPPTHAVRLNGHTFTLPAGFTIELAAGTPVVRRPIAADFDEQGRLYVSDSSGSNAPVREQLRAPTHRILRLTDATGRGVFDRQTVFADRMMFPEGVMWHEGAVYVAAPPSIWKLTETAGAGRAGRREEWFKGRTLTGCANDLHGPYAGRDGWVYWCKGAFAQQTVRRPGRKDLVTRAAHIFRARPDGTGVEPVMTGGMDNPVDVVFTPSGERIFTTTFFQHPAGGHRDGLVHAVYGGLYGKDHAVVYDHAWTAPALMPVLTHLGAAAPAGLACCESDAFGKDYQHNLFAALFNLQKVTRHVLVPDGATFRTIDSDFLVSDNRDFHPTDVVEDADGSLLVVDTGGWYKLCCPTSQLVKPDVLGAVYRVRRTAAPRTDDPRGLKLDWAKLDARHLGNLLGDRRPAVRRRAVATLAGKGAAALAALHDALRAPSAEARRNAVWAATRIDLPGARLLARKALGDRDETVRQAALHSVSVCRDRAAVADVLPLLKGTSPHNRRAAAEALGRTAGAAAVPALLAAAGRPCDRVLEHSLTYALIEIGAPAATREGLASPNPRVRRAALVALDQMPDGGLGAKDVAAELDAADPALRAAAWWVAGRRPAWGGALAGFFRARLASPRLSEPERAELTARMAHLASAAAVQELLAARLADAGAGPAEKRVVLRAMAASGLKEAPPAWVAALGKALAAGDEALLREATAAAGALRLPAKGAGALTSRLVALGNDPGAAADVRLGALAAVPGGLPEVGDALFRFLAARLDRDAPVALRGRAADVLARARLTPAQLGRLTGAFGRVGPMELDRLLDAFARSGDEAVGLKLVAALERSPLRSVLRAESLRPRLKPYGGAVQRAAEALYARLDSGRAAQRAVLEKVLSETKGGDVRRGQAVFNGARAACASCHAIGYLGGKLGPDLTHVGRVRTDRDLLEAILFPSASFVRSYEPVQVTTARGKVYNGLLRKSTHDEIVLAVNATQEVRLRRADVEDVQPGKVSVMPAGLDKVLSARELADLLAFLRACR
jgi:putative membrane-bound dehydrogenase-like protein